MTIQSLKSEKLQEEDHLAIFKPSKRFFSDVVKNGTIFSMSKTTF